jgi:hypothetical protein
MSATPLNIEELSMYWSMSSPEGVSSEEREFPRSAP